MLSKYAYLILLFTVMSLSIIGCTSETSATEQMAQNVMKEDNNSDIFIMESILYKKVKVVNEEEFKSVKTTSYGEISMNYQKNKKFQEGMASVLPPGTKLYRSVDHPEYVYSNEKQRYTLYKSVPEG